MAEENLENLLLVFIMMQMMKFGFRHLQELDLSILFQEQAHKLM
jgi:hypothetical protein